jgi:hypothetical protein
MSKFTTQYSEAKEAREYIRHLQKSEEYDVDIVKSAHDKFPHVDPTDLIDTYFNPWKVWDKYADNALLLATHIRKLKAWFPEWILLSSEDYSDRDPFHRIMDSVNFCDDWEELLDAFAEAGFNFAEKWTNEDHDYLKDEDDEFVSILDLMLKSEFNLDHVPDLHLKIRSLYRRGVPHVDQDALWHWSYMNHYDSRRETDRCLESIMATLEAAEADEC